MKVLNDHIGLSCKVNVVRLEVAETIPLNPDFPFIIVGVAKNNKALLRLANGTSRDIFSVSGFNITLNKGEWRQRKSNK